uniref:Calpain catalytic domain-containing protein n=1 Tax=Electrophorus electricus TaxID=8005 RepID=A0A4W4GKL9_ELEEL
MFKTKKEPSALAKTTDFRRWAPGGGPSKDGLFVDSAFPVWEILLRSDVEWRRPKNICSFPQFIVNGATRMDICQGVLSDCWFLSAVASVSLYPSLLNQVVPVRQSFQHGYTGCFSFWFWQYGEWVEVKVDDLLPTQQGELIYLHSSQRNEFWSALLEKAYAKLKGGYQALNLGFPHEAMVDMTGGITEAFMVATLPQALASFLRPLLAKGALINCANSLGPMEKRNDLGIMFRHAYSVTGLETVKTTLGPVELVRVRNPWGKGEWEGPWSDCNGPEWRTVSKEEQRRLERVAVDDGEFWMSLSDFRQNFEIMEVCHLSNETLSEGGTIKRPWHCKMYHGFWEPKLSMVQHVPQFRLTLLEEDDDPNDSELTCSFLLALMQKHTRQRGIMLPIALSVYQARSERDFLSSRELSLLCPVLSTHGYLQQQEIVIRDRLAPGHYIIVPSTSEKSQTGEFLLRILTEKGNNPMSVSLRGLPPISEAQKLFRKHCNKVNMHTHTRTQTVNYIATVPILLAGSEKKLCLEHCKTFVVLMDNIFLKFDTNKSQSLDCLEISPALTEAGIEVDEFVLQLIGLRYTDPDMTVSYPGFLYLLMKLDSMIRKFQSFDMVGMGTISVNCRQWLHITMYN